MPPVRKTPRRPRSRSAKSEVCPDLAAAKRPLESPSTGQSRPSRGLPRLDRGEPRRGRNDSASPEKRAATRTDASGSVAAAAHHAPHRAQAAPAGPESQGAGDACAKSRSRGLRKSSGKSGGRTARAKSGEAGNSRPELPPGPAPADGRAFVEAVSAHKNLVSVSLKVLDCEDIRVVEKHLDRLLDLGYVKTAQPADLPPVVFADLPRPDRSE